ncbi:MAG: glutamate formimidoyltransferase [Fimbriimonadaceae bacterium]|nr:glutamate formimidoyltransferase [Fimbriimonadaceae bacterium]
MSSPLVECVPNFSEGRDAAIIAQIAEAIESVEGVKLLNVDPGKATNRTVYTFVGAPEPVCEAAFRSAKRASELIDMRQHHGEHPRFGALDVCPLIPISGITMAETAEYARRLGQGMGDELGMSIYLYENAATTEERRNLATVRAGEYEGLERKLTDPHWKPDFGPATFNAKLGATAVGARDFLIAYNVNLNTTSTRRANAIAFDIREKGRQAREGDPVTGKPLLDSDGNPIWIPGSLKAVKAIGWFIDEYGIAQISINLTNLNETSIHECFEECVRKADARGIRVTGSEIVGLVPLAALLDAGRYFLLKQERSTGVSDAELIKIAVRSMGLDELAPFDPNERIIEYAIRDRSKKRLVDLSVQAFVEETASESPAPGGGSVAATLGALGAALATMVANLSSHKRGWDERWKEFSDWADKGKACHDELLRLVDADTDAFNGIMTAFGLPKSTDEEKARRKQAIADATRKAIEIPLQVMEASLAAMGPIRAMAEIGNPNSVSDAGVGALCARSAVLGAYLNVKINCAGFGDAEFVAKTLVRAQAIAAQAEADEKEILAIVESRM